jgi:hypothetical protein
MVEGRLLTHSTSVGVIRSAHRSRQSARLRKNSGLRGSRGDLGGGCYSRNDKSKDDGADDGLHGSFPKSCIYYYKISLDMPDKKTIKCCKP